MRALWTASSGLAAQQLKLDLLGNNIANLNTTGYKAADGSFAELLQGRYSSLHLTAEENALGPRTGAPDIRFGNGVRLVRENSDFAQGSLVQTQQPFDLAIQGEGLFQLLAPEDVGKQAGLQKQLFTRDGHFHLDAGGNLVNDQGYHVLDRISGQPIVIPPARLEGATLSVDAGGNISLRAQGQTTTIAAVRYGLFQDSPDTYLESVGNNLFGVKAGGQLPAGAFATVDALQTPQQLSRLGTVQAGYLEASNVDLSKTMTDLLQVQRAYELNSRAIQTTDQMMGMANNMRS